MTTTALHTPKEAARWLREHVRGQLQADSRRVGPGDGFIAWPGAATDGRRYVGAALAQGATACLVEQAGAEAFGFDQPAVANEWVFHVSGLDIAEQLLDAGARIATQVPANYAFISLRAS